MSLYFLHHIYSHWKVLDFPCHISAKPLRYKRNIWSPKQGHSTGPRFKNPIGHGIPESCQAHHKSWTLSKAACLACLIPCRKGSSGPTEVLDSEHMWLAQEWYSCSDETRKTKGWAWGEGRDYWPKCIFFLIGQQYSFLDSITSLQACWLPVFFRQPHCTAWWLVFL